MADITFRYAEKCLYSYEINLRRLGGLRARLKALDCISAAVQGWNIVSHASGPSDPVYDRSARCNEIEAEIEKIDAVVKPITDLLEALAVPFVLEDTPAERLGELVSLWYIAKMGKNDIARRMNVSMRTLYRMRQKAVELAMKYLAKEQGAG